MANASPGGQSWEVQKQNQNEQLESEKMGTEEQNHPLVGQDPETPGPGVQLSSAALAERNSGGCGREGTGK